MKNEWGILRPQEVLPMQVRGLRLWHCIDKERWVLRPPKMLCIQGWGLRP